MDDAGEAHVEVSEPLLELFLKLVWDPSRHLAQRPKERFSDSFRDLACLLIPPQTPSNLCWSCS